MNINNIREKLSKLKVLDLELKIFGAKTHKYQFHPVLSQNDLITSKLIFKLNALPEDYVEFLTKIGNGGAGPGYGVLPLTEPLHNEIKFTSQSFLKNQQITRYIKIIDLGGGLYIIFLPDVDANKFYYYDFAESNSVDLDKPIDFNLYYTNWLDSNLKIFN